MNNVEIIKEYFLPLLIPKEDKPYNAVFSNAWKRYFVSSIRQIDDKNKITEEVLNNINLNEALDKYSEIINEWKPEKTLEVFWVRGMSIYTFNQYDVLKGFFQQYSATFFNALIDYHNTYRNLNHETLIKLASNHDLSDEQYKIFEELNIHFVCHKSADINDFKKLVKVGKIYNSVLIWETYLKFFESNQIFIHNVKDLFEKQNIKYNFNEEELDMFIKNKFTRTLNINPEFVCRYNKKITATLVDDIVMAIDCCYANLAKEVEDNVEITNEYVRAGNRNLMVHFNVYDSLALYEEKLQNFNSYLKNIIENIQVEKDKTPEIYLKQIDKLFLYYKMENNYSKRQKEKRSKI